jgi:hypothetical protein
MLSKTIESNFAEWHITAGFHRRHPYNKLRMFSPSGMTDTILQDFAISTLPRGRSWIGFLLPFRGSSSVLADICLSFIFALQLT